MSKMKKITNCVQGVLSPLLSNIILHELDKELQERGHSFVRYADDCSMYLKSEKSAHRILESITEYIERKLKLKVNREKTKISRPAQSTLLGFSFDRNDGEWKIVIAPKVLKRVKEKLKSKTKRNDPSKAEEKIKKMEALIRGWVNYFYETERSIEGRREDKEDGGVDKRLGELLFNSPC